MRLTRTTRSVGDLGGKPPRSTRPLDYLSLTSISKKENRQASEVPGRQRREQNSI
jgi:hypothetical protein